MRTQSFNDWLIREVASSRMALVGLYEQKDKLLYVDAPPLRKRYMETIGIYEEKVLEAELEVSLLRQKVEKIQIAVNRREKVDLQKIDEELKAQKEEKIAELESDDKTLNELPILSEEDEQTMQRLYRQITSSFHPAVNKDITETQRELYEKAQNAYRLRDVEAMKLISELLFTAPENIGYSGFDGKVDPAAELREQYREIANMLSVDYTLAKKLYPFFAPLEEDVFVLSSLDSYNAQRKSLEEEITAVRQGFPFNAEETLNDRNKTEEYLAELRIRAKRCDTEKEELERKIAQLTEESIHE